jgi:hypothetical protein
VCSCWGWNFGGRFMRMHSKKWHFSGNLNGCTKLNVFRAFYGITQRIRPNSKFWIIHFKELIIWRIIGSLTAKIRQRLRELRHF